MTDNNESKEVIKIQFDTNANAAANDVNKLNTSIEQTTESVDDNTTAYKSFKQQLREANAELQKAVSIYGETSDEAVKAAKGVAELKDQMGFAKDLAEQFNPDQKFKALGAATQLAGTGLQGVTAGMALFGDQTESTEKALLKVQSAMAFSDAISQLSDLGDQWALLKSAISSSTIFQKANTAATGAAAIVQKLFTGSVDTTATSFKGLKTAIAATGIGLLVVGVTALIQNFDKVKKVVLNFVPGLAEVGEGIMNIVNSVTDFIGITSEAERAIDRMKDMADKSTALNKKFLAEHESQLDEYTKTKIQIVNDYNEAIKEAGADQVALYKEVQRKLAAVDKARQDEIDKNRKEAAEKEKKEREEREKKEKEARDKQLAENKRNAEFIAGVFEQIAKNRKEAQDKADKEYQDSLDATTKAQQAAFEEQKKQEEQAKKDREDRDKVELEQKEAIQNATLGLAAKSIDLFKAVNGKSKDQQKEALIASNALGVAEVVINTQKAVSADLAVPFGAGLPKIPLDIASGALGVASIISATVKGLEQIGRGGSAGSSPSLPKAPSGINAKPQTGFQASSENQIATSINSANQKPVFVKAYVTGKDVTDQQTLDANLVNQNSFGGKTGG